MSTKAAGDGKPAMVDVAGRDVAGESTLVDEAPGTGGGAREPDGVTRTDDAAPPRPAPDERPEDDVDSATGAAMADWGGGAAATGDGGAVAEEYAATADGGAVTDQYAATADGEADDDEETADWEDVVLLEEDALILEYEEDYALGADAPDESSRLVGFAAPVDFDEPAPFRPARRWWTRLLIAAGFLILAGAIVGGAIAIVGSVTHGFKKQVKITYKESALFSLKTGNCFDPHGQSYTLIPCDSPHAAEVFATFPLASGKWPGSTAVSAAASSGCATRLTGYLNPQLAISLASTYVYPDATAWQAGVRTVICEVRATSGDLTGSVRGASATAG